MTKIDDYELLNQLYQHGDWCVYHAETRSENILDPTSQELIDRDFGANDENTALSMQFNHAIFHMVLLYLHGHYTEVIPIAKN